MVLYAMSLSPFCPLPLSGRRDIGATVSTGTWFLNLA